MVKVSVIEPSYAIKRGNGKQTGGRRLALRASLRPQLELWLGLATAYQTKEWLTKGQSDSYVEGSMSYHVREWKTALSDTYIESKNTM